MDRMKVCIDCGVEKELNDENFKTRRKNVFRAECRICGYLRDFNSKNKSENIIRHILFALKTNTGHGLNIPFSMDEIKLFLAPKLKEWMTICNLTIIDLKNNEPDNTYSKTWSIRYKDNLRIIKLNEFDINKLQLISNEEIICNQCNISKDLLCFRIREEDWTYRGTCKKCMNESTIKNVNKKLSLLTNEELEELKINKNKYRKEWKDERIKNDPAILEKYRENSRKGYYLDPKKQEKLNKKIEERKNETLIEREKRLLKQSNARKLDRANNPQKWRDQEKNYRIKNPDIIRAKRRRRRDKLKKSHSYRLRQNISRTILTALKNNKNGSTFHHLPYTPQELNNYLKLLYEPWMTEKNYGVIRSDYDPNDQSTWKWAIDHITPKSRFPYTSMNDESFKQCWALENLRPYCANKNAMEGDKRTNEEIEKIKLQIKNKLEALARPKVVNIIEDERNENNE